MVSLFDAHGRSLSGGLPVELVAPGTRGVALLEFFPVDESNQQTVQPDEAGCEREGDEPAGQNIEHEQAIQLAAMIEAAREQTAAEIRAQCVVETEQRLVVERGRITQLSTEFARDRQRYFTAAEGQVVKLALAMARRVLSYEAHTSPLHLLPTVRAALARVKDASVSTLRVRPEELVLWSDALQPEAGVQLLADEGVAVGEVALETSVGRVELGAGPQMAEIERGFDELLQRGAA